MHLEATTTARAARRYRVEGRVGRGAFGSVYRAELLGEGGFSRQVALKVLNPDREGFEDIAIRLRDEARLLGLLRHRAIVHVDGLVYLDGHWTVVMEYNEGADLHQLLSHGAIPIGPALEVVAEVAGALNVAFFTRSRETDEPLRLLHRDIKPSNILLTPAGEVKVVDFGVAQAQFDAREAVTTTTRFGSLGYMSPERLGLVDGPGGDVYALGAVLYELLAGQPLGRTSVNPTRHKTHVNTAMQRLHATQPHLSTALKGFLSTLLNYEPDHRPTAREVETRCREFIHTLPEANRTWLREWSEGIVPELIRARTVVHDGRLHHSVLVESTPATGTDGHIEPTDRLPPPPASDGRLPEGATLVVPEANPTLVYDGVDGPDTGSFAATMPPPRSAGPPQANRSVTPAPPRSRAGPPAWSTPPGPPVDTTTPALARHGPPPQRAAGAATPHAPQRRSHSQPLPLRRPRAPRSLSHSSPRGPTRGRDHRHAQPPVRRDSGHRHRRDPGRGPGAGQRPVAPVLICRLPLRRAGLDRTR